MSHLLQDLRFGLRMLRRQPGFAIAVIVTLGLGIGSATAVISLADATLLRPVPAHEPERLAQVRGLGLSYPDVGDLQQRDTGFESIAAHAHIAGVSFEWRGATQRVPATPVTGNYFEVIGAAPAAGRLLTTRDETPGGTPAIVVSHRLWQRALGSASDVVGAQARINGRTVIIVGVAAEGFKGLSLANVGDVWMPAVFVPELATGFIGRPAALTRDMTWLRAFGRIRDGSSFAEVSERIDRVWLELNPDPSPTRERVTAVPVSSGIVLQRSQAGLEKFIVMLLAVAGVLLLLGCANVANLLLARAASRRQEMGVRAALGAGRMRLMSQLLLESALIGVAGAAVGVAIAAAGMKALERYRLPGDVLIADLGLRINSTVLMSSIALAAMAVLIFGLIPAWIGTRRDVSAVLREGGRTATRTPLGRSLVIVQVALSVSLVGGGLLFARGLQRAMTFDLGYEPHGVAMTSAGVGLARLPEKRVEAYATGALDRLRADRNISAAGVSTLRPMRGSMSVSFKPKGYQPAGPDDTHVSVSLISDGWVEAVGLPLLRGRTFVPADRTSPQQFALVSESLARKVWPARDPVGERFALDGDDPKATVLEVAGVVGDARFGTVDAEPNALLYLSVFSPRMSAFRGDLHFFARTRGEDTAAMAALRRTLQEAEPRVPLFDSVTLEDHVAGALMPQRLGVLLLGIFSITALVLAAAGVYAVAAYTVSVRRREIGIRVALGAGRGRVLADMVRDIAVPIAAGLAAGLAVQLWTSQLAESFVFGLTAKAPLQLAGAAAVVLAAAALALVVPARRAANVDPSIALRES